MSAELEKIAEDLKRSGYTTGGVLVRNLAESLRSLALIPERVNEAYLKLDSDTLDLSPQETSKYLIKNGLPRRIARVLYRNGVSMRQLATTSNNNFLELRNIGPDSLEIIRRLIPEPTDPRSSY